MADAPRSIIHPEVNRVGGLVQNADGVTVPLEELTKKQLRTLFPEVTADLPVETSWGTLLGTVIGSVEPEPTDDAPGELTVPETGKYPFVPEAPAVVVDFIFGSNGLGRDIVVPLAPMPADATALRLTGTVRQDHLGRWDDRESQYQLTWVSPSATVTDRIGREVKVGEELHCCVTGEICADAHKDFGYCHACPGCSPEFLLEQGVIEMIPENEDEEVDATE